MLIPAGEKTPLESQGKAVCGAFGEEVRWGWPVRNPFLAGGYQDRSSPCSVSPSCACSIAFLNPSA